MTHFDSGGIVNFRWSSDGKHLAVIPHQRCDVASLTWRGRCWRARQRGRERSVSPWNPGKQKLSVERIWTIHPSGDYI